MAWIASAIPAQEPLLHCQQISFKEHHKQVYSKYSVGCTFLLAVMKKNMTRPMQRNGWSRWTRGKTSSRLYLEQGKDLWWPLDTVLTVGICTWVITLSKPTASLAYNIRVTGHEFLTVRFIDVVIDSLSNHLSLGMLYCMNWLI